MGRRLKTFVHVDGVAYGPDSKVPAPVAEKIGDHAWETDAEVRGEDGPETVGFTDPGTQRPATVEAPPRSGRGSSVDAWRAFAEQNGVGVDSDMSREDIIAAAEDAGLIEPEQPKE
ncbi:MULTISPECIES: hypothetical protein [Streptomyces]|uniref:hypothetical protein n=1 Tax=Streptomyces TaxID=1883 RepID=UPI0004CA218B|nr:hypothetical protein [Streptomyces sp. NRRL F-5650]